MVGYCKHNHGRLYYLFFGTGETIVFIHGFSLDCRMWRPQIEHFKDHHQMIVYDLRGFGRSSLPSRLYSHHDDLLALMRQLQVPTAHLVGLSFGGEIAIDFTLSNPGLVKSLSLFDTSLGGYQSTVDWNVYAKELGVEKAKKNWLHHEVFAQTRNNTQVYDELKQIAQDYSGWHWLHTDPRARLDPPARLRLSEVRVPTSIAVGELDLPYFQAIADTITAGIPRSDKMIIPRVGHMSNLEAPDIGNQLIERAMLKATL